MVSDEDLQQIKKTITDNTHIRSSDNAAGTITKIGTALCVIGIAWMMSAISDTKEGISDIKGDIKVSKEWRNSVTLKMNDFSLFMKEPRFTREDFIGGISVVNLEVKINQSDIKEIERELFKQKETINRVINETKE